MTWKDPLGWLIAKNPTKARSLGLYGGGIALLLLGLGVSWLVDVPWSLSKSSPFVVALGSGCAPSGAHYTIDVNGSRYSCSGGNSKCGDGGVTEVAYDPKSPSRCRVRSNVDRPSRYELDFILLALAWLLYAGAAFSWRGYENTGRDSVPLPQSAAYWSFTFGLVGVIVTVVVTGLWYG